jgi:ADP-heptose:LPS heptosyltransferase
MSLSRLKKTIIRKKNDIRHFFNKLRYDYQATTEKPVISKIQHIVIHRLDGKIGDAICYAPFIRELKKAIPKCIITVLVTSNIQPVYEAIEEINELKVLSKKPSSKEIDSIAGELGHCDLYIHLFEQLNGRDFRLINRLRPTWCATLDDGVKLDNIGVYRYTESTSSTCNTEKSSRKSLHFMELLFKILTECGVDNSSIDRSYMKLFNEDLQYAKEKYPFMTDNSVNSKGIVIFNPYGASSSRKLKDEAVIAILKILREKTSMQIVLWVTPKERVTVEQMIRKTFNENSGISFPKKTNNIKEVIVAMASCQLMIGVDTGSAHVAACYNIPALTFYSNNMANYSRWYALSPLATNVILNNQFYREMSTKDLCRHVNLFLEKHSDIVS